MRVAENASQQVNRAELTLMAGAQNAHQDSNANSQHSENTLSRDNLAALTNVPTSCRAWLARGAEALSRAGGVSKASPSKGFQPGEPARGAPEAASIEVLRLTLYSVPPAEQRNTRELISVRWVSR